MKKLTVILLAIMAGYASFAQGYYFEMKMSTTQNVAMGTMKVYALNGDSRSEINLTSPLQIDITSLSLQSNPGVVYMINDKNKSYSEMDVTKSEQWKDNSPDDYEVTVLGKEKVNGYNSTHVKVKRKDSKAVEEMWLSTEVADYSTFMKAKTKFTGRINLYKALEAKGAAGFPVKIVASDHGNEVVIDFVKAEKRDNPASLFSLNGYTKSSNAAMGNMKDMMQQIQNMTPEQRQAFLDQMKQQYQQSH